MLSRAVARSIRVYSCFRPIPIQSLISHPRFYSKQNKAQRQSGSKPPSLDPPNRHGPIPSQDAQAASSTSYSRANTSHINSTQLEEEFHDIDVQIKEILASKPPHKSAPSPAYPTLQDRFQTCAPSDANNAPQSPLPSATNPAQNQQQPGTSRSSQPLPDLTQGIPTTLDAELAEPSEKADPASLNITEDPGAGGGKGELPKTAYISSLERKRKLYSRFLYAFLFSSIGVAMVYHGRNWENEEEERKHPSAPSGWGFGLFYNRVKARLNETLDYYNEPAFPKLLPDPDPAWARPYTLVISLEDLLVHGEWSRDHGWRLAKRPGVDYFLRYLSSYYELVIWTSSPSMIAQPIIAKLDPYRVVMWPLFREATRYQNGAYIKDLSYLNRDPRKIIILETDPSHTKHQPENAIIMPPWKGDAKNVDLINHIDFLEYCATMNFADLREVLKSFQGKNIPQEYARREAIMREKQQKQIAEELKKRPKRSKGFMSALAGPSSAQLVGPDGRPLPSMSEAMAEGKTYQDVVRERGRMQYELLEKEIQENGEKWLKEMAEEEKKLNEEAMQGVKKNMFGWLPWQGKGGDEGKAGKAGVGVVGAEKSYVVASD